MKTKADSPMLRTATTMCSKGTRPTAHAQYMVTWFAKAVKPHLPEAVSSFCEENSDKMGKLDFFLSKFRIGSLLSRSFSYLPPPPPTLSLPLSLPPAPPSPALPTPYSFVSSAALSILTFAAMQVFKEELATEGKMTILGGFIGSWFFVFLLTVSS